MSFIVWCVLLSAMHVLERRSLVVVSPVGFAWLNRSGAKVACQSRCFGGRNRDWQAVVHPTRARRRAVPPVSKAPMAGGPPVESFAMPSIATPAASSGPPGFGRKS